MRVLEGIRKLPRTSTKKEGIDKKKKKEEDGIQGNNSSN